MKLLSLLLTLSLVISEAFIIPHSEKHSSASLSQNAPRHDVGNDPADLSPEVQKAMESFQEHQQGAARLGWPVDVRTLVQYNHGYAVMSTNSKSNPGYPGGSVVGFAPDSQGRPLFCFSGMSTHTQDLLVDPKCSLTVAAKEFKGAADGRVNLMGQATLIKDEDTVKEAKELYLAKHPKAFWVEFGDFNWFRMDVEQIRFVGGFARAGSVTSEEYTNAQPDLITQFGGAIASHMNEDHMEATIGMVNTIPSVADAENPVTEAIITSVDSLGMDIQVTREKGVAFLPKSFKVRLPFPTPAKDRKDVKLQIMQLTQEAAEAAKN